MRPTDPTAATDVPTDPGPVEVVCGPLLCRLRVWTEAEWAARPAAGRPAGAVHAPGLGWVVATPVAGLN